MQSVNADVTPERTLQYLCRSARTPDGAARQRDDHYGCGILDFEHAIESMPWRVSDVVPEKITVLTDQVEPLIARDLENPNLNAGAWWVFPESASAWLSAGLAITTGDGTPSRVTVTTDLDALSEESGASLVGTTFRDRLLACPKGSVNERDAQYCSDPPGSSNRQLCPCQRVPYELRVADEVQRTFLPLTKGPR
jgi:hypothetical protein